MKPSVIVADDPAVRKLPAADRGAGEGNGATAHRDVPCQGWFWHEVCMILEVYFIVWDIWVKSQK